MSKVILTQEQARMFESHKDAVKTLLQKRVCDNCPTSIDSLTIDDVVKAIAFGYEVEPEFKVGDWLKKLQSGKIDKFLRIEGGYVYTETDLGLPSEFRHATPEEIEKEKERRWWRARNRGVWELRARDILKQKSGNELAEVKEVHNSGYLVGKWTCYESKEYIKKHYTVVCLAENRLDVKDDE